MANNTLAGKVIVVTGGGRGLGRAMARAMGDEGAVIVVTGRDSDRLADAHAEFTSRGIVSATRVLDVTDAQSTIQVAASVVEEFGHVDVLFANAGVSLVKSSLDTSAAEFTEILESNVVGTFNCAQAWGRHMLAANQGKIVTIASNMGIAGMPGWAAYAASKAAVINLTKSLAWEWAPNVTVNCLAPGAHRTEMNADLLSMPGVEAGIISVTPLARIGLPVELGAVAVFLAGPGSDFMTGETISVDGGIRRS